MRSCAKSGKISGQLNAYVLATQSHLLQHALAPWPRRDSPLLEINCGNGVFLPLLWQSGFDAIATEPDAELRLQAQKRLVPQYDVRAAKDSDLPFEDDTFDWAILHLRATSANEIASSAHEALRVSRRGLMLSFWNSASLPALLNYLQPGARDWPDAISWWLVWKQVRALGVGRQCGMATLCGPAFTWSRRCYLSALNKRVVWPPFGAWVIIRLDIVPIPPLTGLALRLGQSMPAPEPAMEYAQKNLSTQSKNTHCQ